MPRTEPKPKPRETVSFRLELPPELHRRLKIRAAQDGTTVYQLLLDGAERELRSRG